jgi:type I protein arginine methyltransferase
MANHARTLIKSNGLEAVVEVLQCTAEEVELPEQVDIVISEWMGYFLLRESMLDSVIKARDKWMKPGGSMYPSHARMLLAPIRSNVGRKKQDDMGESAEGWAEFCEQTSARFGVDMSSLTGSYAEEQRQYFLQTSAWSDISPDQLLGAPAVLATYDLNKVTLADIQRPTASFELLVEEAGATGGVDGLAGWFDVDFRGSEQNPAPEPVTLDTSPDEQGATHWGQQAFYLHPPQPVQAGDVLRGTFEMVRKTENHRLLTVHMGIQHGRKGADGKLQLGPAREEHFSIE